MYAIGLKALVRFCSEQKPLHWYKSKLSKALFYPDELPVYEWVEAHVKLHHVLPQMTTLCQQFPQLKEVVADEPSSYYVKHLEDRFAYQQINNANVESQTLLKEKKEDYPAAMDKLKKAISTITEQQYRARIVNVNEEGFTLALQAYHSVGQVEGQLVFGWPYMDAMTGGLLGGDVVSIVGRPAAGKTWLVLFGAVNNWKKKKRVLVVSMEMSPIPLLQRVAAMVASVPMTQLKTGSFSSATYKKFRESLKGLVKEEGELYIVDGNLAASVDDVYELAAQLRAEIVYIDGAYLLRHHDRRMDRYTRVAENVETMKKSTTSLDIPTVASWQFNREASKKKNKEKAGLEDIGYSDAIGQISSIVLGLFQEEGIETIMRRHIDVLKGRSGEVGGFDINWLFDVMDFDEVFNKTTSIQGGPTPKVVGKKPENNQWL